MDFLRSTFLKGAAPAAPFIFLNSLCGGIVLTLLLMVQD
jgi:hypothetical protein